MERSGALGPQERLGCRHNREVQQVAVHSTSALGAALDHRPGLRAPEVVDAPSDGHSAISSGHRSNRWMPWIAGVALAVLVLGPALGPGALFSLDLILPDDVPVPRGVWGLGPELPRRVPLMVPVAWLAPLVSSAFVVKVMTVGAMAGGFAGMERITRRAGPMAAYGAAAFYAASPFLVTRIAAGHLMIVFVMGMLPWCYPVLLRPAENLPRTVLWSAALGFTGNYGGMVAAVLIGAGLVGTSFRRWPGVVGAWFVGQLPWFVPGLVVFGQGASLAGAAAFATRVDDLSGWIAVAAGHGFWQDTFQVGAPAAGDSAAVALVATGLAMAGTAALPESWGRRATVLAAVGIVVVYGSALPGLRNVIDVLARTPIGANLRESQRAYPLVLMWLAPAMAFGAARAASRVQGLGRTLGPGAAAVYRLLPLVGALVLTGPALWGINGHLVPTEMPAEWEQAKATITANPGTVAVLPWYGYTDVQLGGTHHVLNPWPIYLGGDVLVSSDLRTLTTPTPERIDPREVQMSAVMRGIDAGEAPSARLAELGVRWVVFHRTGRFASTGRVLDGDAGLERVQSTLYVHVYRVRGWVAPAIDTQGRPVWVEGVVEPVAVVHTTEAFTWHRPFARGWLRGWSPATETAEGLVSFPAGSGVVWYWPTLLVLLGHEVTLVVVVLCARRVRRSRRASRPVPAKGGDDASFASRNVA